MEVATILFTVLVFSPFLWENSQNDMVILALWGVSPKDGPLLGSDVPFPTCSIMDSTKEF